MLPRSPIRVGPPPPSAAASAAQRAPGLAPRLACRAVGETDRATSNAEGPLLNHPATAVFADTLPRRQRSRRRPAGWGGRAGRGSVAAPVTAVQAPTAGRRRRPPCLPLAPTWSAVPPCYHSSTWLSVVVCTAFFASTDASCVQHLQRSSAFFDLRRAPFPGVVRLTRLLPPRPLGPPLFTPLLVLPVAPTTNGTIAILRRLSWTRPAPRRLRGAVGGLTAPGRSLRPGGVGSGACKPAVACH